MRFFKFSTVRMKLVGSVLLLIVPALLFMYNYDLPMSGFVVGVSGAGGGVDGRRIIRPPAGADHDAGGTKNRGRRPGSAHGIAGVGG